MRIWAMGLLAVTAPLAGCHKQGDAGSKPSAEAVASAVAEAPRPQAGRWESTVKIDKMDMGDIPPEAQAMMQKSMGAEKHYAICLTPEQAANPNADFYKHQQPGCTYDHFSMAGGKIDAAIACTRPDGKVAITLAGDYSATSYSVHTTSKASLPGGRSMQTEVTMASRRVGDCNGSEMKAPPPRG